MFARRWLLPLLVAGVAVYYWQTAARVPELPAVPSCAWRVGTGSDARPGRPYDELAADTAVHCGIACDAPLYVYVVSHSADDGTLLWFPSPMLRQDLQNPLPAGRNRVPGRKDGRELHFAQRPVIGATTWIALASRQPLAGLDDLLPKLRQASNTTFTDGTVVISNPLDGTPPIGGPRSPLPHPLLQQAADRTITEDLTSGPMHAAEGPAGVWFAAFRTVSNRAPDAGPPSLPGLPGVTLPSQPK